jgi:hypothetical protein
MDRENVSKKISRTETANVNAVENARSTTNRECTICMYLFNSIGSAHLDDFKDIVANNIVKVASTIVLTAEVRINEGLTFVTELDEISNKRNIQKHIPGKEDNCTRRQTQSVMHSGMKSMGSRSKSSVNKCIGWQQPKCSVGLEYKRMNETCLNERRLASPPVIKVTKSLRRAFTNRISLRIVLDRNRMGFNAPKIK